MKYAYLESIFISLICLPCQAKQEPKITLSFAVVPQQSASKLARLWTPILNYLTKKSGYQLQFKTAKDIPTFERRVLAGDYDLAYMNPYHYTVYHQKPGYNALAKAKNKRIKGIIVVRKNSNLQNLSQLRNKNLAFPSPAAFAATILTQATLNQRSIPYTPKYVKSHDSVYRNVAKERFAAGGGVIRTFKNATPAIREQLRILWTTPGYTPHAIAGHPRIPFDILKNIQLALVTMDQNKQGKNLLKNIKINGFEIAHNQDWDDVRKLGIDLLNSK